MTETQTRFDLTIPTKEAFKGKPYLNAPALALLADHVIEKHADLLAVTSDFEIAYLWKARGGASRGKALLANCVQTSALTFYFCEQHFVIWFAADHLAAFKTPLTEAQYEALMFRQLLHVTVNENTESPHLRGYDITAFHAELERYGPWDPDLKLAANAIQPGLFDLEEDQPADAPDAEAAPYVPPGTPRSYDDGRGPTREELRRRGAWDEVAEEAFRRQEERES